MAAPRARVRGRLARVLVLAVLLVAACSGSDPERIPSPTPVRVGVSSAVQFPVPGTAGLPTATATKLQAVLDDAVDQWSASHEGGAPGITGAVLSDKGAWTGAAGVDGDRRKLTPDAMMAIASISKTFVAAEVMKLAEAGRIDLDAPLSTYVSLPLAARNGATVRGALAMRTGILDGNFPVLLDLFEEMAKTPGRHWTVAEALEAWPPRTGPPAAVNYANVNYMLLGLAIERVTGRTLAQVQRSDLFEPAGLRRIAAQDAERPTPPLAITTALKLPHDGYLPGRSAASFFGGSASGLAADAATIARWGYLLYGGRVVSPASSQAMTTSSGEEVGPGTEYGLGTSIYSVLGPEPALGHLGETVGYTSLLAVLPSRRTAAVLLLPAEGNDVFAMMRQLLAAAA